MKLDNIFVRHDAAQNLTDAEKEQVRENIGATLPYLYNLYVASGLSIPGGPFAVIEGTSGYTWEIVTETGGSVLFLGGTEDTVASPLDVTTWVLASGVTGTVTVSAVTKRDGAFVGEICRNGVPPSITWDRWNGLAWEVIDLTPSTVVDAVVAMDAGQKESVRSGIGISPVGDAVVTAETKLAARIAIMASPPVIGPITNFCAVGDSITDRATAYSATYDSHLLSGSGWPAILEMLSNRKIVSVPPTVGNVFKVGNLYDRTHGYSGANAYDFVNGYGVPTAPDGSNAWPAGFKPIEDAVACDPDCYIVHIGTNGIIGYTTAQTIAHIYALWAILVATGKPVIGTDILPSCSTRPNWNGLEREKLEAINTALRSSWLDKGLAGYRNWADLISRTDGGYANANEFPNDGLHPTMRVGLKLGADLHAFLQPYYAGTGNVIPADGHASWVTPNPYVSGDVAGKATSWAAGGLPGDTTYAKVSDSRGAWQRVTLATSQSTFGTGHMYARRTTGLEPYLGQRCVVTAKVRVSAGSTFRGIGLYSVFGSGSPSVDSFTPSAAGADSPIRDFEATIYSDPFTVPLSATQIWVAVSAFGGIGSFDFQKAGVILV